MSIWGDMLDRGQGDMERGEDLPYIRSLYPSVFGKKNPTRKDLEDYREMCENLNKIFGL